MPASGRSLSTSEDIVASQNEEIAALKATVNTQADNEEILFRLIKDLRDATKKETQPNGEKTLARIAKTDEILKIRGPTTLKELERILKISPREMSRIITKLDKRRYGIYSRNGDERDKVIRLKFWTSNVY